MCGSYFKSELEHKHSQINVPSYFSPHHPLLISIIYVNILPDSSDAKQPHISVHPMLWM